VGDEFVLVVGVGVFFGVDVVGEDVEEE